MEEANQVEQTARRQGTEEAGERDRLWVEQPFASEPFSGRV